MHTLEKEVHAYGSGDGSAQIQEEIEFELDVGILGIDLPPSFETSLIDGASPRRPLSAGRHTIHTEYVIFDAYSESIENIKAYSIGTNSKIEYDIVIVPEIDLDYALILFDSINDSKLTTPDVIAITGQRTSNKKRVSETQYSAKIHDLLKDQKAVIKVGYTIEDTESFLEQELGYLTSLNLSEDASDLLSYAQMQMYDGNYTRALEYLEESKAVARNQEKQDTKLETKCDAIENSLLGELQEINNSISLTNSTLPFIDKLEARKAEIERVLNESANTSISMKFDLLDRVDLNWLGKELTSLKKSTYKEYNNLKERFYIAGNSTTPHAFLEFENMLNHLETSNRLEYAMKTLIALENIKDIVISQENFSEANRASNRIEFEKLRDGTNSVLENYTKESAAAKGTEYSSLFRLSEKKVEDALKDAEKALDLDSRVFELRSNAVEKYKKEMQGTLETLSQDCQAKLSLLETLIVQTDMGNDQRAEFNKKLDAMRGMVKSGSYVNALRAGSAISKELDSSENSGGHGILLLGITSLAILAAAGAYMFKQNEKKPKRPLRKLTSFKDKKEEFSLPKL